MDLFFSYLYVKSAFFINPWYLNQGYKFGDAKFPAIVNFSFMELIQNFTYIKNIRVTRISF